jgi:D-3-phosphoglycerate dehydrogenase
MPLAHSHINEFATLLGDHGIEYDVPDIDQPLGKRRLKDRIGEYDGVLIGFAGIDAEVIEAADKLKVISQWGVGLDDIDLEAAEKANIDVYNTPGAFASEIADVVMGMLIMLTRDLHRIDRAVREGDWPSPRGTSLSGKTMGIVGVGEIGSAVARRASAHGMELLGYDTDPIERELITDTGIESASLSSVFNESFAVSINCPLTKETHHLVGKPELESLGPEGYLINTARGSIVDENALISALEEQKIAGAGLDVYETEPLSKNHPMRNMEQVVLSTHNAGHTTKALKSTTRRAVQNLVDGIVR